MQTPESHGYAVLVCVLASLGGLFMGYDQSVTSAGVSMATFLDDFGIGWHGLTNETCTSHRLPDQWTAFAMWYSTVSSLGCVLGALSEVSWTTAVDATRPSSRPACSVVLTQRGSASAQARHTRRS